MFNRVTAQRQGKLKGADSKVVNAQPMDLFGTTSISFGAPVPRSGAT